MNGPALPGGADQSGQTQALISPRSELPTKIALADLRSSQEKTASSALPCSIISPRRTPASRPQSSLGAASAGPPNSANSGAIVPSHNSPRPLESSTSSACARGYSERACVKVCLALVLCRRSALAESSFVCASRSFQTLPSGGGS